jgi:hypothetical protein
MNSEQVTLKTRTETWVGRASIDVIDRLKQI